MSAMDDLKARARSAPTGDSWEELNVTTGGRQQPEVVIEVIASHFGAEEACQEVKVILNGDLLGYVSRTDAYDLFDSRSKGIGGPTRSMLPDTPEAVAEALPGNPTMREIP
jgi:hypothetical protein